MTDRQRQVIEHRMAQANAVIAALAAHGSRAFYSAQYDLTGCFYVDSSMQGWWVDPRTGLKVEASKAPLLYEPSSPEFSLLTEMLTYLHTRTPFAAYWFDRFDYPAEEFAKVWEAVKDLELICKSS